MNPDLEHLISLQTQDVELKHNRSELAAGPGRLRAAELQKLEVAAQLSRCTESLQKEEALRQRQESDAEGHRLKLARLRRQLEAATSAAQITALEHEISFGETAVRQVEDAELESLGRTEELVEEQVTESAALARATDSLQLEQLRTAEQTRHHTAVIDQLVQERSRTRDLIPEALMSLYDRVSKSRGMGVAEAVGGQCSACRMKVRPQRWNDLAGREHEGEIFTCESCGRILFYDPRHNTPGAWPAGDRLTAALMPLETTPSAGAPARVRLAVPIGVQG